MSASFGLVAENVQSSKVQTCKANCNWRCRLGSRPHKNLTSRHYFLHATLILQFFFCSTTTMRVFICLFSSFYIRRNLLDIRDQDQQLLPKSPSSTTCHYSFEVKSLTAKYNDSQLFRSVSLPDHSINHRRDCKIYHSVRWIQYKKGIIRPCSNWHSHTEELATSNSSTHRLMSFDTSKFCRTFGTLYIPPQV